MAETRMAVFFNRGLTCNQLVRMIIDQPGTLLACRKCHLFVVETEACPEDGGLCPHCGTGGKATLEQMTEPMLADMVGTDEGYRVCDHCRYAFFWCDEKCIENKAGEILVPAVGEPAGKKFVPRGEGGPAYYECPRCGRETE